MKSKVSEEDATEYASMTGRCCRIEYGHHVMSFTPLIDFFPAEILLILSYVECAWLNWQIHA